MQAVRFSPLGECLAVLVVAGSLVLFSGCETKKQARAPGGSEEGQVSSGEATTENGTSPEATGATKKVKFGEVTLAGTVKIKGGPAATPLDISAKPECGKQRVAEGMGALNAETIVAGADGGLKDCIVFISKGLGRYNAKDFVAYGHPEKVVIDQKGCQYIPHVFALHKDQTVLIKNSDPFLHNVSIPQLSFNLSMPNVGEETRERFFKKTGPHVCQCSVHPWMSAYAYVVSNPFFSQTGEDGKFSIGKLPDADGTYTVEAWHQKDRKLKAPKPQRITVKNGAVVEGNIVFEFTYKG